MDSQSNQIASAVDGVSKDELNQVKRLFTALLLTVKNLSLYPPGHTIFTNSVKQFHSQLTTFLNKYKTLKLEIERERIIYRGETISEEPPVEGTLHYTLFRDGIKCIELMDGMEAQELSDIMLIINKYTKLAAEPEGDIVTSFWEIQFPHLRYEVAELLWGGGEEFEKFSDLISGKSTLTQSQEPEYRENEYAADPPIDLKNVILTSTEKAALQKMIKMEEDAERTSYLDALLDSLLQHREETNFSNILEAFSEEFTFSLMKNDFIVTLKIIQGLKYVLDICREELPWARTLIENFIIKCSGPEVLAPLKETWEKTDPEDTEVLRDIFTLLDPKVIETLVHLLSLSQPAPIRMMLLDLIVQLASQDTHSLELALKNASENLIERLIAVITRMEGGQALKYLSKLSQHPSGRIRCEAVRGILSLEPSRVKDMLNMVDDRDDTIRKLVLEQMGQSRDDIIEEFLISYIKNNKSGDIHADHMILCYRTLGRCGSSRSVPFLRETLLRWGFIPGGKRDILRRGAAIALGKLDIPQADQVLERAGRSLFPRIKNIVNKVRHELNEEADGSVK